MTIIAALSVQVGLSAVLAAAVAVSSAYAAPFDTGTGLAPTGEASRLLSQPSSKCRAKSRLLTMLNLLFLLLFFSMLLMRACVQMLVILRPGHCTFAALISH